MTNAIYMGQPFASALSLCADAPQQIDDQSLAIAYPLLTGDTMQPTEIPDTVPELILRRWKESARLNTRAGWRQMAELCGRYAMSTFCENDYNPDHKEFKALCKLARTAHARSVACLVNAYQQREARA